MATDKDKNCNTCYNFVLSGGFAYCRLGWCNNLEKWSEKTPPPQSPRKAILKT